MIIPALSILLLLAGGIPAGTGSIPLTDHIYSISTGPGADASVSMTVSWAADTTAGSTRVLLTELSDICWDGAISVEPEQKRRTDVFDGIFSAAADGSDACESAIFDKYGTTLCGLKPDTDYKYIIVEDGPAGKAVARSREYRFRTAGAENWSACIISDFHSYPPLGKRLVAAMGMIDTVQGLDPSIDWILSPGDVVAWGGSYSFWKRMFEEDNFREFFWARVNGNHDNWTRESQVTHNFDIPNHFFTGTSYYPQNGYPGEMGVCYYFRYGNTLFVMLNTEDMEDGAEFDEAAEWLRKTVTSARIGENPPTFVVVCQHYQWFNGTDGRNYQYKRFRSIFDELGVDLAISGNDHVYVRSHPLRDGKPAENGTVYIVAPSSDNDRGREFDGPDMHNADKIALRWTEGKHTVGAIHLAVGPEKMVLTLLDRNGVPADRTEIR